MKVTMLKTLCGPDGNAYPGTVLDVQKAEADELIRQRAAREFDPDKDKKPNQIGLVQGHETK